MNFEMSGPAIALGLPLMGSAVGCYIAGAASHAAIARTEESHGKFIGLAAIPSTHAIYGFLLMFLMAKAIQAGTLSPLGGVIIGVCSGAAIGITAYVHGKICATAIQSTVKDPSLFGKCFASVGIIESVSLFAFVFSYLLFA
jgi:V/A-type H+-transporting ATPase subunit K